MLVDDQILFVKSLNIVIKTQANDIDVVGIAYDGQQALEVFDDLEPDVVFMDIRMPNMTGVECAGQMKRARPQTHVVMLTTFDDDEYVSSALEIGASGYLLKDMPPEELIAAIRFVAGGGVSISPTVASAIVARMKSGAPSTVEIVHGLAGLTEREREVLDMIRSG